MLHYISNNNNTNICNAHYVNTEAESEVQAVARQVRLEVVLYDTSQIDNKMHTWTSLRLQLTAG